MAGMIILLIFVFILMALLIMPIHVRINPEEGGTGRARPGFFRLSIDVDRDTLFSVILYIFFIRFSWYPLQKKSSKPARKKETRRNSKSDRWNWNRVKFLIKVAWESIKKSKVKKLYLDLDTSNVIINANLYPVFELMNKRPGIDLHVNYAGNFALSLDVQNRLWNVFQVFLTNLLKRVLMFTKIK